jgi:pantoate--beta-alanine ligase
MRIVTTIREMQALADDARRAGKVIGLVPTMGYFHEGHVSLMRTARERADLVVVTLFVNPTQFAANEDLSKYPRDFERDRAMAESAGVDAIFFPSVEEMYPAGHQTVVTVPEVSKHLCGAARPVHFQGVATVCAKLFAATKPHFAVFGEKDYQQIQVIRRMVADLNLGIEIVAGALVREADGLAMSSRNVYLSPTLRAQAPAIHRSLLAARDAYRAGERDPRAIEAAFRRSLASAPDLSPQYVHVIEAEACVPIDGAVDGNAVLAVAVLAGATRLIDNLPLTAGHHEGTQP